MPPSRVGTTRYLQQTGSGSTQRARESTQSTRGRAGSELSAEQQFEAAEELIKGLRQRQGAGAARAPADGTSVVASDGNELSLGRQAIACAVAAAVFAGAGRVVPEVQLEMWGAGDSAFHSEPSPQPAAEWPNSTRRSTGRSTEPTGLRGLSVGALLRQWILQLHQQLGHHGPQLAGVAGGRASDRDGRLAGGPAARAGPPRAGGVRLRSVLDRDRGRGRCGGSADEHYLRQPAIDRTR